MIEPILFVVGIIGGWVIGLIVGIAIRDHEYNRIGMKKTTRWTNYGTNDWRPEK